MPYESTRTPHYFVTFANDLLPRPREDLRTKPSPRPEPSFCSTPAVAAALAVHFGRPVAVERRYLDDDQEWEHGERVRLGAKFPDKGDADWAPYFARPRAASGRLT
jgi:hypothetical protein